MRAKLPNIEYSQAICLATLPATENHIANVHLMAFKIEQKVQNILAFIFKNNILLFNNVLENAVYLFASESNFLRLYPILMCLMKMLPVVESEEADETNQETKFTQKEA